MIMMMKGESEKKNEKKSEGKLDGEKVNDSAVHRMKDDKKK